MEKKYELSFTSRDCISSIKEKISAAKKTIDIEAFYFTNDEVGYEILNLLIKKAKEGLKIRLLFDHLGSYELSNSNKLLKDLKNLGIKIIFFNSILPFSKNRKTLWFLRDHRRCIIIDDEYLFTGSVCIGQQTIDWKELGIFIKDKDMVSKTRNIFNQTWNKVYQPTFNIGSTTNKDTFSLNEFNYITQSPLQFKRHIYRYYINSIKTSKENIYLVSPYFVPDRRIVRNLIKASKRHVHVNIILPKNTEIPAVDLARNTYIHHLLKNNINIYFHNEMLHSKFSIFDNRKGFIGTLNLDNLSLRYNYECGVTVLNPECISELQHYVQNELITNSTKLELNSWNKRSFFTKILERFVWFFKKFL